MASQTPEAPPRRQPEKISGYRRDKRIAPLLPGRRPPARRRPRTFRRRAQAQLGPVPLAEEPGHGPRPDRVLDVPLPEVATDIVFGLLAA